MNVDIKGAAKAHGVSITELAERLGVSRQSVHYYIEQGERNPIAQLEKIANAIGCNLSELFEAKKPDFIAFVRLDGVTHTFDTFEALKRFTNHENLF